MMTVFMKQFEEMIENCINTYDKFFSYHNFNEMESRNRPKKLSIGFIQSNDKY